MWALSETDKATSEITGEAREKKLLRKKVDKLEKGAMLYGEGSLTLEFFFFFFAYNKKKKAFKDVRL